MSFADVVTRLSKRCLEDRQCEQNNKRVADLLQPENELFQAREQKFNLYTQRLFVDHQIAAKKDKQYGDDLEQAVWILAHLKFQPMSLAPRDGTLLDILVRPRDENQQPGNLIVRRYAWMTPEQANPETHGRGGIREGKGLTGWKSNTIGKGYDPDGCAVETGRTKGYDEGYNYMVGWRYPLPDDFLEKLL